MIAHYNAVFARSLILRKKQRNKGCLTQVLLHLSCKIHELSFEHMLPHLFKEQIHGFTIPETDKDEELISINKHWIPNEAFNN